MSAWVRHAVPDLADPGLYADHDPHAVWRALRAYDPVYWQPVGAPHVGGGQGVGGPRCGAGPGFWAATRYADVDRILRDDAAFVSGTRRYEGVPGALARALRERSVAGREAELRGGIRRLVRKGGGSFDFAEAIRELPLAVLGPLLGLPEGDRPHLGRLAIAASSEEAPGAGDELFAYLDALVQKRVRGRGDDLVGTMLGMRYEGVRLTPSAVAATCHRLLLATAVTLSQVPVAAVMELSDNGGYAAWAARPDLLGSGVEESLRWASPTRCVVRTTRCPVELSGVVVPEGQAVVAVLASANRDRRVFADPDRFDVARRPNRHLAFGAGAHGCVGADIARSALRLLFTELFAAYARLEVVGEPVRMRSVAVGGVTSLPVRGRPRRAPGG